MRRRWITPLLALLFFGMTPVADADTGWRLERADETNIAETVEYLSGLEHDCKIDVEFSELTATFVFLYSCP